MSPAYIIPIKGSIPETIDDNGVYQKTYVLCCSMALLPVMQFRGKQPVVSAEMKISFEKNEETIITDEMVGSSVKDHIHHKIAHTEAPVMIISFTDKEDLKETIGHQIDYLLEFQKDALVGTASKRDLRIMVEGQLGSEFKELAQKRISEENMTFEEDNQKTRFEVLEL